MEELEASHAIPRGFHFFNSGFNEKPFGVLGRFFVCLFCFVLSKLPFIGEWNAGWEQEKVAETGQGSALAVMVSDLGLWEWRGAEEFQGEGGGRGDETGGPLNVEGVREKRSQASPSQCG